MDAARDPYSQINPDSPWRWMPVAYVLGLLTVVIADGVVPQVAGAVLGLMLVAMISLWAVSICKVGAHDAVTIAQLKAKANGARRINSHPVIARTMFVIGCALVLSLLGVMWATEYPTLEERGIWQRMLYSPAFPAASCLLAGLGWTRPWDLEVVERDAAGVSA